MSSYASYADQGWKRVTSWFELRNLICIGVLVSHFGRKQCCPLQVRNERCTNVKRQNGRVSRRTLVPLIETVVKSSGIGLHLQKWWIWMWGTLLPKWWMELVLKGNLLKSLTFWNTLYSLYVWCAIILSKPAEGFGAVQSGHIIWSANCDLQPVVNYLPVCRPSR